MNCLMEALGLALPGNGTILAVDPARLDLVDKTGKAIMDLVNQILVDEDMVVFPIQLVQTPHFPQFLIHLIIKDVIKEAEAVVEGIGK